MGWDWVVRSFVHVNGNREKVFIWTEAQAQDEMKQNLGIDNYQSFSPLAWDLLLLHLVFNLLLYCSAQMNSPMDGFAKKKPLLRQ